MAGINNWELILGFGLYYLLIIVGILSY